MLVSVISRSVLGLPACVGLAAAVHAQCEPASTHRGFHLQAVGFALAADGDQALFGQVTASTTRLMGRLGNDTWESIAMLSGSGSGAAGMGRAVDLRGDLAVVGDPANWSLPGFFSGSDHGAAVVYERSAGTWVRLADLYSPTPATGGRFGATVAIATDGSRLVVGEPGTPPTPARVHVYVRQTAGFALEQTITGASLSPPTTINTVAALVAGHLLLADGGATGQVRVLARNAGTWAQVDVLAPPQAGPTAYFGWPIAVDGTRAAIGAQGQTHPGSTATGMVLVYDLAAPGWASQPVAIAPPSAGVTNLGRSLALRGDRLAVGANGRAFVFELGSGGGSLRSSVLPPAAGHSSEFGRAVALYSSGLLVGDHQYDDQPWQYPNQPGGVHTFDLNDHGQPFVGCARGVRIQGSAPLPLQVDWAQQAGKAYQVFGSITGTGPTVVGGVAIPLTPDIYTSSLFGGALPGLLLGSAGVLSPSGRATVTFVVPPGLPPSLHGLQLHHAVVAFDATSLAASNAVTTTLVHVN